MPRVELTVSLQRSILLILTLSTDTAGDLWKPKSQFLQKQDPEMHTTDEQFYARILHKPKQ